MYSLPTQKTKVCSNNDNIVSSGQFQNSVNVEMESIQFSTHIFGFFLQEVRVKDGK